MSLDHVPLLLGRDLEEQTQPLANSPQLHQDESVVIVRITAQTRQYLSLALMCGILFFVVFSILFSIATSKSLGCTLEDCVEIQNMYIAGFTIFGIGMVLCTVVGCISCAKLLF